MSTMTARLLSVEDDETGVATMLIDGIEIAAMNCLWYGHTGTAGPAVGALFEPTFSCLFDDDEHVDWESVFTGNPGQEKRLHRTRLWSYRASGQIVEIEAPGHAALTDCGGCLIPLPIAMSDPAHIGAFVGFDIQRLSVSLRLTSV